MPSLHIACSFDVYVSEEKDSYGDNKLNVDDRTVITSDWLVPPDSVEFDPDILESFRQCKQYKEECKPGKSYHVFMYGTITPEYSYSLESGREFDWWLFEDEFVSIQELSGVDKEEPNAKEN